MITARRSLLCDFVQQADAGKLNLLGVFDRFWVDADEGLLSPFCVYFVLAADSPDELDFDKTLIGLEMVHKGGGEPLFSFEVPPQGARPEIGEDMKLGIVSVLQFAPVSYRQTGHTS